MRARSRNRGGEANYWPGFVDALTTLLLVIIFLLVVFVLAQVVLSQAISGKDAALDRLNQQVRELADLLDLERRANAELRLDVSRLTENLKGATGRRDELELLLEQMSARASLFEDRAKQAEAALADAEGRVEADRESVQLRLRQLESLRRDIDALRTLRAELESEVALLNAALDDAKDRILVLDERLVTSKAAAADLRAARDALAKSLEERRLRIVSLEAHGAVLESEVALLNAALDDAKDRILVLDGRLATSKAARDALAKSLEERRLRIVSLEAHGAALESEVALLNAALDDAKDRILVLDERLVTSKAAAADLRAARDALAKSLEERRLRIVSLEAHGAALESEVALLNAALDDAKDRILVLDERLATSKAARDALAKSLEERRLRIVSLEAHGAALAGKLETAEADLGKGRRRARDLAAELADARRIAAALLEDKERLTGERDALGTDKAAAEAETRRIVDELRATNLLVAALRKDKAALERERERLGERAADERLRLDLAEARGDTMVAEAADLRHRLGELRDRSKQLEARLADAAERTLLAQKTLEKRDVRLAELALSRADEARAAAGATAALTKEKALSERRRLAIALLNEQIQTLRREIERLSAALDLAAAKDAESQAEITDLGRRLNRALAAKVEELARYRSEFFGRLKQVLGARRDVEIVGDRFVFQSEVLFGSGSDELGSNGREQMARLAAALLEISAEIPPGIKWVLRVDGHTDNRPIRTARFPSNWELSTARAISVVHFLVARGVPPERLAATGFAAFQPIDSRDDEVGWRRNRRIELKLTQR